MVKLDLKEWTSEQEIHELTTLFETREAGRVGARLQVARVTVLKNTFGSFFTEIAKSGFTNTANFKVAQDIAWEEHLSDTQKWILTVWRRAAFPTTKDLGLLHKQAIKANPLLRLGD